VTIDQHGVIYPSARFSLRELNRDFARAPRQAEPNEL
jgi:hypothetical protein